MSRMTRLAVSAMLAGVCASPAIASDPAGDAFGRTVWIMALPEPGTLALLGIAAVCLALFRRRRKSKPPE